MSTTLFEDATSIDEASNDGPFGSVDISEIDVDSDEKTWVGNASPMRWLFGTSGRGKLVDYALEQVATDEIVFHNKRNLGEHADTSRHSVHRYIDDLVTLGIYEARTEGLTRYRANKSSTILSAIAAANDTATDHDDIDFNL